MKKLKEEFQPGGSKRQEILDKAVSTSWSPTVGNPEHEACYFCWIEVQGCHESEVQT